MRSTSKRRLDMSRVFHGLRPFTEYWRIKSNFGPTIGPRWLVSPCDGDLLFAPVHDAAPSITVTVDPRARSRFAGDSAKPNGSDGGQR